MAEPQESRPSDSELVEACLGGNAAAWGELIARFSPLVYSVPRRHRLSPEACEDVFQEVFAILLRELPRIRDTRTLPKWLITVAVRESLRIGRRSGTRQGGSVPEPVPLPAEELTRLEQHQLVRDCLRELEEPCRSLLRELFSVENPDYSAISTRLSMPIGSIGPTRGRCLKKLLAIVREKLPEL